MAARAELETTVQQLSFSIIPVLEGVLVLPLIGSLDHARLSEAGNAFVKRSFASARLWRFSTSPALRAWTRMSRAS